MTEREDIGKTEESGERLESKRIVISKTGHREKRDWSIKEERQGRYTRVTRGKIKRERKGIMK